MQTPPPTPDLNKRTVLGIEMEAVRFLKPVPHWRVKVVATGTIYDAGVFKGSSRPAMWEDVEHVARIRGEHLWVRDSLAA